MAAHILLSTRAFSASTRQCNFLVPRLVWLIRQRASLGDLLLVVARLYRSL